VNAHAKFLGALLLAGLVTTVRGQTGGLVADRPTLNGILGGSAYTETFAGYTQSAGTATNIGATSLDSTTILNSQGPNLVAPGVTYTGSDLQWNAPGYYDAVSNEIMFNGGSITLTFAAPTNAFGVDVRDFHGFSANMTVTVFAPNDTTVLNTYSGITIADPAIFFGYQNSGGIGAVTLSSDGGWSPIITNLTFAPVPEPPALALMASGLAILLLAVTGRRIFRPHQP
jgi:hypothetical protein